MIVIIGGGPAGISAALAAAENGAQIILIESSSRLGGQYWRHKQGQNFSIGNSLTAHSQVEVLLNAHVWHASYKAGKTTLNVIVNGKERIIETKSLIMATGAYDRSLPFPGWNLPGVMTPGGAQALLKGSGVGFGKKVVVAGTGPFLLPVATGLAQAGVNVIGFYEANSISAWMPHLPQLILNPSKLREAFRYAIILRKYHIKQKRKWTVVAAHADSQGKLARVTIAKIDRNFRIRNSREIDCDSLAIGWGFTSDLSLANNLGVQQEMSLVDQSMFVRVDKSQKTNLPGVFAAGEITGIGGWQLSVTEGRIAGLAATDRSASKLLLRRFFQRSFATALIKSYPVMGGWQSWLNDETIICRCEEVSLAKIKYTIHELGAEDARTVKLLARPGMGMCQGRICGRCVVDVVASESGQSPTIQDRIGLSSRPIVTPVPLSILAVSERIE